MKEIDGLIFNLNNFKTRSSARKKLLAMGPDHAGEYLLNAITDPGLVDNAVWAVTGIFTEWRYEKSVPYLVELLKSRPGLQSDISRSLNTITGLNIGADPNAWQAYLSGPTVFSSLRAAFNEKELIDFSIVDDFCKIYLPTVNGRKHEVLVYEKESKLRVYTECGYILQSQRTAVEELAAKVEHSQLSCEVEEDRLKVTLTAEWNGIDTDFKLLKDQIIYFASFADDLENQLTGEDNI